MTTRRRTASAVALSWVVVTLAGACSNSGRANSASTACGSTYEALFTSIVVTVSAGDVQSFQNTLIGRHNGTWYDLFVEDQVAIDSAEPTENTRWKAGEKILAVVKANPNNVGNVLADGATWSQRGRVAYLWEYGPFEGSEDDVLIVSTFRLLEGETLAPPAGGK